MELVSAESEAAEVKELFCVQMSPDILGSDWAGTECEPYIVKEPSCVQMSSDILGSELCGLELGSAEFGASIVMELVCVQLSTDISGLGLAGVERASAELVAATMPGAFSPGGFGGAGSQCVSPAVGAEFEANDVKELFCVQRSSDLSGSEWAGLELVSAESEAAVVKELFCVQMSTDI